MKNKIKRNLTFETWNALDIQFANILTLPIMNNNLKKALIFAGASLSASVRSGHVCLPLNSLTINESFIENNSELDYTTYKKLRKLSIDDWQELLFACPAVSDGSCITPLVLENQRLYLYHMWKDECIVARFFNHKNKSNVCSIEKIIIVLNQLFPVIYAEIDWHKIATAISIIHQRVLISGGPGTGKTFAIAKIIAALLLCNEKSKLNIKITTPTGKASVLLTESFNQTIKNIPQLDKFHLSNLPEKAITLHNLLTTQLKATNAQDNHLNPINLDILVIDEASMVSMSILAQLVSILTLNTKVIFLGDSNQLYSVEPGSVFKDVCQFSNFYYSIKRHSELSNLTGYTLPTMPLYTSTINHNYNNIIDGICILKKNYRFNDSSGIHKLADAIKVGNHNQALSLLTSNSHTDLSYTRFVTRKDYITMIINCAKLYSDYFNKLQTISKIEVINVLKFFNDYRILCALRDGPFGIKKINYYVEQILHEQGQIQLYNAGNYIGKPIIILHNTPALGLYNGDIGVFLLNKKQNTLSAYFLSPQNSIKIIPIYQLPKYETCYAMTIHKTQGSEFHNIIIILPDQHMPILTRELFYTAITRSCQYISLYTTDNVVIDSINLKTERYSGLYDKIKKNITQSI